MKKLSICLLLSALLSIHESNAMQLLAQSIRALRTTQVRHLPTCAKPKWPDYSITQAELIRETTIRNNHLTQAHAYDRELRVKIEAAAAQVCPDHHPSKCRTCWLPQSKAFNLVSEDIYLKNKGISG